MQIFVINLEKDQERRLSIAQQFFKLNLAFEFFPGVYGKSLSPEELATSYSESKALRTQGRLLTSSEIGCALSHIGIYREIIRRNLPAALVLEDDVLVSTLRDGVLSALSRRISPAQPSVILLSPARTQGHLRHIGCEKINVGDFADGYYAHAYVISHTAARALLKFLYPVGDVADCWGRIKRHRVVDIAAVSPPLVLQDQARFGSSTTSDIKETLVRLRYPQVAMRKCRRAFWLPVDNLMAFWNRVFHPYMDVLKNRSVANPKLPQ